MRILVDTQIFIWSVLDSDMLCAVARRIMLDADKVYVSAASIWEYAIPRLSHCLNQDTKDLHDVQDKKRLTRQHVPILFILIILTILIQTRNNQRVSNHEH